MSDQTDTRFGAEPVQRQPIFNAPLLVVLMAVLLVVLHAVVTFSSDEVWRQVMWDYAVFPARFWAPAGTPEVYPDHLSGLLTLLSTALLHADWMHVIVNSLMLLAFGTPVARALGQDARGWGLWMLVFVGSVIGGSALYLALSDVNSPYLVGASGGTSGLMAAAFLVDPWGGRRSLLAREFVLFSVVFALVNALLVVAGPYIFGAGISWEAHLGGYIVGAILMSVIPLRAR
ncbi:MAG: rhomboid family intramembrane serine protease [Hyphomonadaceae bacterium]